MALTGYIFSDLNHIEPFLEDPYDNKEKSSPSLMLARHLASTLSCHVIIGFPYKPTDWKEMSKRHKDVSVAYDARPIDCQNTNNGPVVHDDSLKYYNAALLVDRDGNLLHIFRKHFNFEDDKRWSQEGPGFETITLPGIGKVCVAICMDLNCEYKNNKELMRPYSLLSFPLPFAAYNFQTPFETYELARYCQREKVDILVMSLAWLTSLDPANEVQEDNLEGGSLADTINGWATRLSPFLEPSDSKSDFYFVACNRTGTEKAAKFAGSSCAMRFSRTSDEPCISLLGAMSRKEGVKIFGLPLKSSSSS